MNRHLTSRLIVLLIGSLFCGPSLFAGAATDQQVYVVTVRPDASVDGIRAIAGEMAVSYGGTVVEGMARGEDTFVIRVPQSRARVLAVDPRVKSVAPMRLTPSPQAVVETVPWGSGVSYSYDGTGNVTQIGSDAFVYDGVDRLMQATVNGVHRTYAYDDFGNRTSCNQFGPNDCQGFPINIAENKNRIAGAGYDTAGNISGLSGHVYSYDAVNMMTRDAFGQLSREFVYTAEDERIATYSAGSSWNWTIRGTDGKVLREFTSNDGPSGIGTSSWSWVKDYVWRNGLLLASRQPDGTSFTSNHYHLDHLGTPRRVTDQSDRITGVHDYLAFGPEMSGGTAEPSATALKYTGHERDSWSSGSSDPLDYMHARYYSPTVGRFLSPDPLDGLQRFPQSWNRYAYARNNPLKYIDPTGQYVFAECTESADQCQADKTAFEQARQHDLGSPDQAVHDAAAAYGDPGQINGVSVAFGNLTNAAGTTAPALQGNADGTMGLAATVTIQTGLSGTALNAAVGHEGQHVLDAQGFVASFTKNAASWDLSKNLTKFQTETNGYRITDSIYRSAHQPFSMGCQGCTLGTGARTPADRDLAITRILADPSGVYKVTSQNQGNRQFPEWTTPPPQP